jgi:hypothetical protein
MRAPVGSRLERELRDGSEEDALTGVSNGTLHSSMLPAAWSRPRALLAVFSACQSCESRLSRKELHLSEKSVRVSQTLFERAQEQLIGGVLQSVSADLPQGPYRDFCLASLSPENPDRSAWLQLLGAPQLVRLTLAMLDGIVQGHELERPLEHSIPMNVYESAWAAFENSATCEPAQPLLTLCSG